MGGGIMGSGIAETAARAGCEVTVIDVAAAEAVLPRIDESLSRAVSSGKLSENDARASLSRISAAPELSVLDEQTVIIEAVPEIEDIKLDLFARLDSIARPDALLATNTSSIPVARIAAATTRPEKVIGVHFFNPVPILPLVELVPSMLTASETTDAAAHFATEVLGKRVIHAKDQAGFVVNALLIPYLLSAVRMYDTGVATAEDIDQGMVDGCAHPLGPLQLIDLIGIDTTVAIADALYAEFKEPHLAAPPALRRMCDAGILGRKSGHGFYQYTR
ncbi:3-hydroxybutyryl-CoA dehydrogenase [Rhodococcus sp. LB1]|uniref:3-hydroxybutyryl-CoA dehydrogenase n=1 Tax=Rhodococcus sp. LB1 TaxID=1807499 RepID=UPI0022B22490|nr:3-hydroxybutyryl-CoA dehydrogenase [Rhodococcus sp. LB1]